MGEEHEEADGDVGVLDAEVDGVDGGHVDNAEAAVQHHQLVQEGAGLLLQGEVDQRRVGGNHQHRGHPPQYLPQDLKSPLTQEQIELCILLPLLQEHQAL